MAACLWMGVVVHENVNWSVLLAEATSRGPMS